MVIATSDGKTFEDEAQHYLATRGIQVSPVTAKEQGLETLDGPSANKYEEYKMAGDIVDIGKSIRATAIGPGSLGQASIKLIQGMGRSIDTSNVIQFPRGGGGGIHAERPLE